MSEAEVEYACDKFVSQRYRKDVCKVCFQPKRLHELKIKKGKPSNEQKSTVTSAADIRLTADIKTTNKSDAFEGTKHIEHGLQQKEGNLNHGVLSSPVAQLATTSSQSRVTTEQAIGSKVPAVAVNNDRETEQLNNANVLNEDDGNGTNGRRENVTADHEGHKTPLDNNTSDIKVTNTPLSDTAASFLEGSTGNDESGDVHNEGTDSKVKENIGSFPLLVESDASHVEGLPTKFSPGEEDIHKEITTSAPQLIEENKEEQSYNEVPNESGGQATPTQDDSDHPITSTQDEITPTLPSSSIQDDAIPSLAQKPWQLNVEEAHKDSVCDEDKELEPATVELLPSNDDITSAQVASDPAPPTLVAADNQAPPMIVNDQGFNIPAPPPPPPIQAPPPPPLLPKKKPLANSPSDSEPEPMDEMLISPQDEERGRLLSDIRLGAQLKHVPWPKERKAGEYDVNNVESELRHMIQKRRKKEVTDMVERVEMYKDQIDRLIKDIMEASKHAQRLVFLKMLQDQITKFLQTSQLSLEVLEKRCLNWPANQISALSDILDFMNKLEVRVQNVEALCHNSTVNPDAVQRCAFEIVKLAKECDTSNTTTRFSLASSAIQVSQTDIDGLILRASQSLVPLLDKLYEKAFNCYRIATDGSTNKFELKFRLTNAQRLLKMCCSISDCAALDLRIQRHVQYSEAQLKTKELQVEFNKLSQANDESEIDASTKLKATEIPRNPDSLPRKTKEDYVILQKFVKCIQTASLDELDVMLCEVNAELYRINELRLIKAAISSKKVETVKCVAYAKEKFDWDENLKHAHDYDWLCEAVTMGFCGCLEVLVQQCGVCVNAQSIERAQTALHIAARKPDFPAVLQLLKLGADPLMLNSDHRTPLQLIAIKNFPFVSKPTTTEVKEFLFDLSEYLYNPSLSDVTLVSKDSKKYPAHRLVLCAQSGYFKALLGSDLWQEGTKNEVSLGMVDGAVLQIMLEYMYTGKCLFPRDDLSKALELFATAEMFLLKPMSVQCEAVLSEKLTTEVVVPIYQTAALHVPKGKLHFNCCHYILMNYKDIEDPDHQILNEILENKI